MQKRHKRTSAARAATARARENGAEDACRL